MFKMHIPGRAVLATAAAVAMSVTAGVAPSARAAVQVGQTVELGEIGVGVGFASIQESPVFQVFGLVFAGTTSIPTLPTPQAVAGKPFDPITVNFSGDTLFEYTISAPAGQRYRIDLPAGSEGAFSFKLEFEAEDTHTITRVPATAVGLKLDGVPQLVTGISSGVHPNGGKVHIENTPKPEESFTASFSFSTLTLTLDYAYESGPNPPPLVIDDVTRTLSATPEAFIAFTGGNLDPLAPAPTITLEPVPEPASLALLALGAAAFATRRR